MLWAMRCGLLTLALLFAALAKAQALEISDDLTITGYGDLRVVAPTQPQSWLEGGLGKFRYGGDNTKLRAAEAVLQADLTLADGLHAVTLLRAEPQTPGVIDALESYLRYAPAAAGDLSWSVKMGAFFPSISLENDDLGWASPYTLTPSAINSWIGDELRTIGSEATLRWKTNAGTLSLTGALTCCNDEAGIVMADRGWAMDDRPSGLFERVRLPTATLAIFHAPPYARTGLFDEIDGTPGWYAGAAFQMPGLGRITVTRYDNQADPAAVSTRDTAWRTRFWNFGARTAIGPVTLIAQQMSGSTEIVSRGNANLTKFESGFLLASTDVGDWRFSLREDLFQTRRAHAANATWNEDGDAFTASASWSPEDWLRLTGEVIAMRARRGEYVPAGLGPRRDDTQTQVSTRFFF